MSNNKNTEIYKIVLGFLTSNSVNGKLGKNRVSRNCIESHIRILTELHPGKAHRDSAFQTISLLALPEQRNGFLDSVFRLITPSLYWRCEGESFA